jgi:hypothetical protein
MNGAVVESASLCSVAPADHAESGLAGLPSDWIDPEGDDWLSAIYRELTQDPRRAPEPAQPTAELEHWFG